MIHTGDVFVPDEVKDLIDNLLIVFLRVSEVRVIGLQGLDP